ncbi:uncharacterized protein LOC125459129 isoform X2 [Stegostoma tigrinum]|uniref:uncharacterized protein LOC125459129 isoform X2 n=1 Tax=Stegostoma tigrinum TaxID=3053191 RepID=UPI00202B88F8|nr:uncharacterized protein LOC125459129 isoform X2 [Stegostoma tigrinum]
MELFSGKSRRVRLLRTGYNYLSLVTSVPLALADCSRIFFPLNPECRHAMTLQGPQKLEAQGASFQTLSPASTSEARQATACRSGFYFTGGEDRTNHSRCRPQRDFSQVRDSFTAAMADKKFLQQSEVDL